MRFTGKTVYITQSNSAVGKAIARRFASEGADLVLGDAEASFVDEIKAMGNKVLPIAPDLTTYAGTQAALDEILKVFKRVDVLVFNNNKPVKTSIADLERSVFEEQLNYNAKAGFTTTKIIGQHMGSFGNGKIVYVSSIHDDKPTGSTPLYAVAKGTVTMLCKESALFFGRMGVQSNLIEVGALEGDDSVFDSTFAGQYVYMKERIPRDEAGKPEEIAGIAAFLASDDANFVNGASLRADGGFMLHYRFR